MTRLTRRRPRLEPLDGRILLAAANPNAPPATPPADTSTAGPVFPGDLTLVPGSHPSANRFRAFTPADLQSYANAYLAFSVDPRYNPALDFNGTGFIGQNDATPILRGLKAITPKQPFVLTVGLAPGEAIRGHHPSVNGAATHLARVTVVGKTTPNSILFYDAFANSRLGASGNFKFQGGAFVSDSQGRFSYTLDLTPLSKNSITTLNLLVRTPLGHQTIRAFPIIRVGTPATAR